MASTLTLVPASDHAATVAFTEVRPEDAGFLYQPTINGKVYITKSSLSAMGWDGKTPLTLAVK